MTNLTSTVKPRLKVRQRILSDFAHFVVLKSEGALIAQRQEDVRIALLDDVEQFGETDDNGNSWFELDEPVFTEAIEGRRIRYTWLKRERHLTPANPLPEPELAEDLLRKRGLWLSRKTETEIQRIQQDNPYVTISVSVDVEALAKAVLTGAVSDDEYEATLKEQKETFQFRPTDSH